MSRREEAHGDEDFCVPILTADGKVSPEMMAVGNALMRVTDHDEWWCVSCGCARDEKHEVWCKVEQR